jgi:hypothetical protein
MTAALYFFPNYPSAAPPRESQVVLQTLQQNPGDRHQLRPPTDQWRQSSSFATPADTTGSRESRAYCTLPAC